MSQEELNKRLVLDAFDTLFNRRDYVAAANYWSPHYLQHSAHIPPGREGLFDLIRGVPMSLRYESQLILANREFVMVHGRFSNTGRARNWVAVDIVRIGGGLLVEHWDVLQDEASKDQSLSGLPMFGNEFVD
jgi:predicted SnoaL-like aldol condensation-catalyzing enzyme